MKISFARIGYYTGLLKIFLQEAGLEVVLPEKITSRIITEGSKNSPEMFCLPFKVNMGNYLSALNSGVKTFFMVTASCGSCRLRYYADVAKKILDEKNLGVDFIIFDQDVKEIVLKLSKITKKSPLKILWLILGFVKEARFIESLERQAFFLRPREKHPGTVDKLLDDFFLKVEQAKNLKEFLKLKSNIQKEIKKIPFEKKRVPRVGIIGEIYTILDPSVNFQVEKKLGRLGLEVHRELTLSYHLLKKIFFRDFFIQRAIRPYLRSNVGGHGRDAIFEMLKYSREGFDGVVQLLPFACFIQDTSITLENYEQKPIQEIKAGEMVITHRNQAKKVIKTFCRHYQGPILKINCGQGLLTVSATPEHPFLVVKTIMKNNKKQIEKIDFLPASKLKEEDLIVIPLKKGVEEELKNNGNKEISLLAKIINDSQIRKLKEEIIKLANNKNYSQLGDLENYFFVPVSKIEISPFNGNVYNLEVEDDHSYLANFLAAHNCMPEVTVRPILEKIHQEKGIPFLSLSFDEETAEAGLETRLEAFADVVKSYFERKKEVK